MLIILEFKKKVTTILNSTCHFLAFSKKYIYSHVFILLSQLFHLSFSLSFIKVVSYCYIVFCDCSVIVFFSHYYVFMVHSCFICSYNLLGIIASHWVTISQFISLLLDIGIISRFFPVIHNITMDICVYDSWYTCSEISLGSMELLS